MYMVLKSRDCVFKMSIVKKLLLLYYKKLSLRAAVVANRSVTASMLYGCQIGGFVAS